VLIPIRGDIVNDCRASVDRGPGDAWLHSVYGNWNINAASQFLDDRDDTPQFLSLFNGRSAWAGGFASHIDDLSTFLNQSQRVVYRRFCIEEASAIGLPGLFDGSGIARSQVPAPGSVLHAGERVRVQFAR
jgi:hypothetical protein